MTDDRSGLLRELHDEHAPALRRFVVRLTGDRQLAEDVVQETLLRAWRNPDVLRNDRSRRSWLFTVARNLVIDDWRSARARNEIGTDTVPERASADHTDAVLEAWLVSEAISQLSPPHREVLVHSFYGQKTVAEIGEQLGIPDGTVKSRLHYALRALRLSLQEKGVTR
ncbi:sigma-70 family RNA polymerase sigma factor [Subtercola boreus]|uniref:sigma-70 family RNA polymerase sigma factor n=1 Tax=Subtercola boreus TaxID=120213 RepID=UPI00263AAE2B|nr:sigma-70 family RNA polymerase sigma factor [Subtercola boreus]